MAQWIGLGGTINRKFIDVPMKIMGFSCEFPVIFPLNQSIEWPYLYIPSERPVPRWASPWQVATAAEAVQISWAIQAAWENHGKIPMVSGEDFPLNQSIETLILYSYIYLYPQCPLELHAFQKIQVFN